MLTKSEIERTVLEFRCDAVTQRNFTFGLQHQCDSFFV